MSQSSSAASSEGWNASNLSRLCAWTHQWSALHSLILIDAKLTKVHMEQLIHLSNLTTLQPGSFTVAALPYLRQFPHLNDLSLYIPQFSEDHFHHAHRPPDEDDESCPVWMDAAAPVLASCSNLTSVTLLIHVEYEDARFDRLFRSLPHLRRCTLNFGSLRDRRLRYFFHSSDATFRALSHVGASLEELSIVFMIEFHIDVRFDIDDLPVPRLPRLPKLHTLKRRWIGWDRTRSRSRFPTLRSLMVGMHLSCTRTPMLRTVHIIVGEETSDWRTFEVDEALLQEMHQLLFTNPGLASRLGFGLV